MYKRHEIGKYGEEVAVRYLKSKQYMIMQRNFSCRQGEIDIVALNDKHIIFVEVKTRSNLLYGNPAEAVDRRKQKHIYNAAKYYLYLNKLEDSFVRFDVIEIFVDKNVAKLNHIKQVM